MSLMAATLSFTPGRFTPWRLRIKPDCRTRHSAASLLDLLHDEAHDAVGQHDAVARLQLVDQRLVGRRQVRRRGRRGNGSVAARMAAAAEAAPPVLPRARSGRVRPYGRAAARRGVRPAASSGRPDRPARRPCGRRWRQPCESWPGGRPAGDDRRGPCSGERRRRRRRSVLPVSSSPSQAGPTVATILVCESRGRGTGRSGMVMAPWVQGGFPTLARSVYPSADKRQPAARSCATPKNAGFRTEIARSGIGRLHKSAAGNSDPQRGSTMPSWLRTDGLAAFAATRSSNGTNS